MIGINPLHDAKEQKDRKDHGDQRQKTLRQDPKGEVVVTGIEACQAIRSWAGDD